MFDVVRFTEYHRYRVVIIENVVEATRWELFPDWLRMMDNLGYSHRILSLNSMFFHPTPQSRDRIYVVFWRKGNRAPNLEYRPPAPCAKCGVVEAACRCGRTAARSASTAAVRVRVPALRDGGDAVLLRGAQRARLLARR
jgi:site-specific DNA-cytosine methylase